MQSQTASTPEENRRRDEKALILLFLLLLQDTQHMLFASALRYLRGDQSALGTSDDMTSTLLSSHAHSAYLGRRLAGNRRAFGDADKRAGQTAMYTQVRYMSGLLGDLRNGRYVLFEGELPGSLTNRLNLYVKRLRGTSEQAWIAQQPDEWITWVLGANENHCSDCPRLADAGPYRASRMPTTPGRGDTPCLSSCHCYLLNSKGEICFQLPSMT